jgi:hypothetical protein
VSRRTVNLCHHLGPAEIDSPGAAQQRGILDEDDLIKPAEVLQGVRGLDQAAGDLPLAGPLMRRAGAASPAGAAARAGGDRVAQRGEFAAGLRQELGGFIVLDMGEEPQVSGIELGLAALRAPGLGELAKRLVD